MGLHRMSGGYTVCGRTGFLLRRNELGRTGQTQAEHQLFVVRQHFQRRLLPRQILILLPGIHAVHFTPHHSDNSDSAGVGLQNNASFHTRCSPASVDRASV